MRSADQRRVRSSLGDSILIQGLWKASPGRRAKYRSFFPHIETSLQLDHTIFSLIPLREMFPFLSNALLEARLAHPSRRLSKAP